MFAISLLLLSVSSANAFTRGILRQDLEAVKPKNLEKIKKLHPKQGLENREENIEEKRQNRQAFDVMIKNTKRQLQRLETLILKKLNQELHN